jgi:23S rRNA (adenine2503-C2)-methyltransferase
MRIEQLRQTLRAHGAKTCHEDRILRAWLLARPLDSGPRRRPAEDFHPLELREALPRIEAELNGLVRLRSSHPGADGSERLLVELADGQTIESVLLPRDGLCVSTQVGCAVGCVFCMTGRDGLLRQLNSAEIVAQVVLARARRVVKRVVFMGMGEPAHNLEPTPNCAPAFCPKHRNSIRLNWSSLPSSMPGGPAIRFNTNGRCSKASTTAKRKWMALSGCSPANTPS